MSLLPFKGLKYINISSSFPIRSRCLHCQSGPYHFYDIRQANYIKDIGLFLKKSLYYVHLHNLNSSWYFLSEPKWIDSAGDFSFVLMGKSYIPNLFRGRDTISFNVKELVGCECGATRWTYGQSANTFKPEILHRKGKYTYP